MFENMLTHKTIFKKSSKKCICRFARNIYISTFAGACLNYFKKEVRGMLSVCDNLFLLF